MEANDWWNLEDIADDVHAAVGSLRAGLILQLVLDTGTNKVMRMRVDGMICVTRLWSIIVLKKRTSMESLVHHSGHGTKPSKHMHLQDAFRSAICSTAVSSSSQQGCPDQNFTCKTCCRKERLIVTDSSAIGLLPDIAEAGGVIALIPGLTHVSRSCPEVISLRLPCEDNMVLWMAKDGTRMACSPEDCGWYMSDPCKYLTTT